ncbi:hypothetical protein KAR91_43960 [Candidatus Pacearchaeota archaeon]|nr:hypothetical protein [Candidatus Pacearchaeota archaeon]
MANEGSVTADESGLYVDGETVSTKKKKGKALPIIAGVAAAVAVASYGVYQKWFNSETDTPGKYPTKTLGDNRPVDDGSIVSRSSYLNGLAKMEGDKIIPDDIDSKYPSNLEGTTLAVIEAINDSNYKELSKYALNPKEIFDSWDGTHFKNYEFKGSQESDTSQRDKIGGKKLYGKNFTKKSAVGLVADLGSGDVTLNMFYVYSAEDDSWFLTSL